MISKRKYLDFFLIYRGEKKGEHWFGVNNKSFLDLPGCKCIFCVSCFNVYVLATYLPSFG